MFYDRFVELCRAKNISPAAVAREIGLNNSSSTAWKRGSIPKSETLRKLADYFGVSVDYLLGKTNIPYPDKSGKTERFSPWTSTDETLFRLGGFQALAEFNFLSEADKEEALKDINKFVEFTLSKYQRQPPQEAAQAPSEGPQEGK